MISEALTLVVKNVFTTVSGIKGIVALQIVNVYMLISPKYQPL